MESRLFAEPSLSAVCSLPWFLQVCLWDQQVAPFPHFTRAMSSFCQTQRNSLCPGLHYSQVRVYPGTIVHVPSGALGAQACKEGR